MRREMKLLLIELDLLRTEAQQRALADEEANRIRQTLTASLSQAKASRDHWRREAKRLGELVATVPPRWVLWWRGLSSSSRACTRRLTVDCRTASAAAARLKLRWSATRSASATEID